MNKEIVPSPPQNAPTVNPAPQETPIAPIVQPAPILPQIQPTTAVPFIDPKLINAIIEVESGGDLNAVGDLRLKDHAYGCMQIRQGVVDQVNAHLGTHYKSQDCLGNKDLSVLMFTTYYKIFNYLVTNEERAKGWNGGAGWEQLYGKPGYEQYSKNLDEYWLEVQHFLN